mmetsp:Transcript_28753/g.66355  ORF Transcript_28753/g.66355 Transcript_28753/m.66355 type:complete len:212 (+) Transcript_28753:794-1429(+)
MEGSTRLKPGNTRCSEIVQKLLECHFTLLARPPGRVANHEVDEGALKLSATTAQVLRGRLLLWIEPAKTRVAMALESEVGECANAPDSVFLHSAALQKLENFLRVWRDIKPENKRSDKHSEDLLHEERNLVREQLSELVVHLNLVRLAPPALGHVVCLLRHLRQHLRRLEVGVSADDEGPGPGEGSAKHTQKPPQIAIPDPNIHKVLVDEA